MASNSNHGFVRGSQLPRQSRLFEGRFGRLFRSVPEFDLDLSDPKNENAIVALAKAITAGKEEGGNTPETEKDGEENPHISAGYTYLGQFIDHDITFDPASSLERLNDPEALVDFRTPRFDLDSVYGRGPADQPYMYVANRELRKFQLGDPIGVPIRGSGDTDHFDPDARDHLRAPANKRALIGDKRNDENVVVAQLHTIVMRFHNQFAHDHPTLDFEEVQQAVRWHYQWVVLHDYLIKIVGRELVHEILPHLKKPNGNIHAETPRLQFYGWKNDPYIPTEFSVAAFRFGHSMVRPIYRLNRNFQNLPVVRGQDEPGRRLLFDNANPNNALNGFKPIEKGWAIEWDLFFPMKSTGQNKTRNRLQPAYKVDTSLVDPLGDLPEFHGAPLPIEANLPYRNIQRGFTMRLPCGQDVARAMSIAPLEEKWLRVGKAENEEAWKKDSIPLSSFGPFGERTPLWIYILAEGAKNALNGEKEVLGPVGGRIVAETMIGMMLGDTHSFLSLNPRWMPDKELGGDKFNMARLIQYAVNRPIDP